MKDEQNTTRLQLEKYFLNELDPAENQIVEEVIKNNNQLQVQLDHMRQHGGTFKDKYPTFKHLQDTRISQGVIPDEEEDSILFIDSDAGKFVIASAFIIFFIIIFYSISTFFINIGYGFKSGNNELYNHVNSQHAMYLPLNQKYISGG